MIPFTTVTLIKSYIAEKHEDQLFSIRELLSFGSRSAVDRAVGRLVRCGAIVRVVRGLYIRPSGDQVAFSSLQLASAKAQAFGKRVFTAGANCLADRSLENRNLESANIFAVLGCSSSFESLCGRIFLRSVCPKYIKHGDSRLGLAIRGLIHMGKRRCSPEFLEEWLRCLNDDEYTDLRNATAWMPGWLSDLAKFGVAA